MTDATGRPDPSTARRVARAAALTFLTIGVVWAVALLALGGVSLRLAGRTITSHEPLRPFSVATLGVLLLIWADGPRRAHARWLALVAHVNDRVLAIALSTAVVIGGVAYSSTAASFADAYGYVSQADLWVAGDLHINQPWVAEVPWPNAKWSFSPLGYRPIERDGDWRIVPTYSPGLPLLMAGAKIVAGHCAMFWIVPLFGGIFVLATYGVGRRLGSPVAGLIGAWFVATSPAVLFVLVVPMTDVPVAAAWTAAFFFLLGPGAPSALAAGLLAGLAILIRPNLVFLGAILGAWYLLRFASDRAPGGRGRAIAHAALFAAGVAPFAIAVALINQRLYGSATTSGYGSLDALFGWSHVWPNMQHYAAWLVETQTPVVLAGVAALVVPLRTLWPGVRDRRVLGLIGAFVLAVWACYWAYLEFDNWWYLRFLLPSWPFIMLGLGAVAARLMRDRRPAVVLLTVIAVFALGVFELRKSASGYVFDMWRGERRYIAVAQDVGRLTDANSVVLSMQQSGSIRYYGGRMTMRYDQIDRDWLDRAVAWLSSRGVHSYLLAEEWELAEFKKRFEGQRALAAVTEPPILIHTAETTSYLYDLSGSGVLTAGQERIQETYKNLRCVPPVPAPTLVLR